MKISELRPGEQFLTAQGVRGMVISVDSIVAVMHEGGGSYVFYERGVEVVRDDSKQRAQFPGHRIHPEDVTYVSPADPEVMDEMRRGILNQEQFGNATRHRGPTVNNVGPRPGGSRAPRR